jgi:phosphonate metabolism protein (transferase hexapeptide repeat family)
MTSTYIEAMNLPAPVRLSETPTLAADATIRDSRFGRFCEVGPSCRIEHSAFGDYSYIGHHGELMACDIGKFVNIAAMVRINPGFHPLERPCLHHILYRGPMYGEGFGADDAELFHWRRLQRVRIGHDVWIGHGVVIMPGVTIGNGAVIGSGSIVTGDVPAWTIAAGNPCRPIRPRFSPSIARAIEAVAWWDWSHAELQARQQELRDVRKLLAAHAQRQTALQP